VKRKSCTTRVEESPKKGKNSILAPSEKTPLPPPVFRKEGNDSKEGGGLKKEKKSPLVSKKIAIFIISW